jgi:hypothetical protein
MLCCAAHAHKALLQPPATFERSIHSLFSYQRGTGMDISISDSCKCCVGGTVQVAALARDGGHATRSAQCRLLK